VGTLVAVTTIVGNAVATTLTLVLTGTVLPELSVNVAVIGYVPAD